MRLIDWIKQNNYNIRSFSKEFGLNHRNVEMWCRGERQPRPTDAEKIIVATNNLVNGEDFYNQRIYFLKKQKGKVNELDSSRLGE